MIFFSSFICIRFVCRVWFFENNHLIFWEQSEAVNQQIKFHLINLQWEKRLINTISSPMKFSVFLFRKILKTINLCVRNLWMHFRTSVCFWFIFWWRFKPFSSSTYSSSFSSLFFFGNFNFHTRFLNMHTQLITLHYITGGEEGQNRCSFLIVYVFHFAYIHP